MEPLLPCPFCGETPTMEYENTIHRHLTEWQPIHTAPKNGREILGWRDDCGVMLIQWSTITEMLGDEQIINEQEYYEDNRLDSEDWFYIDFNGGGRLEDEPTHWMNLPTEPSL